MNEKYLLWMLYIIIQNNIFINMFNLIDFERQKIPRKSENHIVIRNKLIPNKNKQNK